MWIVGCLISGRSLCVSFFYSRLGGRGCCISMVENAFSACAYAALAYRAVPSSGFSGHRSFFNNISPLHLHLQFHFQVQAHLYAILFPFSLPSIWSFYHIITCYFFFNIAYFSQFDFKFKCNVVYIIIPRYLDFLGHSSASVSVFAFSCVVTTSQPFSFSFIQFLLSLLSTFRRSLSLSPSLHRNVLLPRNRSESISNSSNNSFI